MREREREREKSETERDRELSIILKVTTANTHTSYLPEMPQFCGIHVPFSRPTSIITSH